MSHQYDSDKEKTKTPKFKRNTVQQKMPKQRSAIYTIEGRISNRNTKSVIDRILRKITALAMCNKYHPYSDMCVTRLGEEEFIIKACCPCCQHMPAMGFPLNSERSHMIEQLLSTLYKCIITRHKYRDWNKAHLTIIDGKRYQFHYSFDSGIQWLEYVNPKNPALLSLNMDALYASPSGEKCHSKPPHA